MALPRNNNDLGLQPTRRSNDGRMDIDSPGSGARAGLLTHTLVSSPIIQWILPARLRGKYQNDVVFVGERSLQIKEAVLGIHLEEVTSKSDFDAHIMAAKVINVSTELPWEAQMKLGSSNADVNLKKDLPPQIMALSLASRELVFLYYSNTAGHFIHYHRPLPNDVSTFERFGRNIAVEPRSRAVAVSASCDYFGVFILKKPPVLQSQMAENQLDPVAEERFFRVDGDIVFMEFLYPRPEDGDKIILLLLVSHDQITHAVCYEWNANQVLRHARPRITKKLLPFEDRLPTMLIPLTKTSSFMLITTTSMTIYKNKLDPQTQPNRYPLPVPDIEPQRSPLWTRWARPLRNWLYNQKHDDIYLCREDGRIFYLGIGNEGEVENQAHLGRLCCDVDAAFDILDIGHEGGDLLLAAGNTGDGGLFIQKAREHPRCVQKFMNWTPVTDSVILKSHDSNTSSSDRLFVCSASSFSRGAVVELRYGIEAQIGFVIPFEELSNTRDLWTIPDNINGGVYVLTSDPVSSNVIYIPANDDEELSAIDEADCGLDFNSQTLAAGHTDSGVLIQVTNEAILLGATAQAPIAEARSNIRLDISPKSVVVAAVTGPSSLIAVATRGQQGTHLSVKRIDVSEAQPQLSDISQPIGIPYDPVCMAIETFEMGSFVFIGAGNGKLFVYRIRNDINLVFEFPVVLNNDDDDISKAIDSIAIVQQTSQRPCNKFVLLCGLRSGFLIPLEISLDPESPATDHLAVRQTTPQHLGHTSVKVQGSGNTALLTCGNGFWQASCLQEDEICDCTVQRICITDQNNPAYYPKNINSFTLTSIGNPNINGFSGSLFCIADGQLMIGTLDQSAKTIPRRINLPGSATKLAYSQHLRSLIVAYTKTTFETETDPIRRFTRPYIEFVDPDLQHSLDGEGTEESKDKPWRPQGAAGEKISCILEWTPTKDDETYHFIVIGTARRNQQERGRVIFLQASRDSSSAIECSVKYIHKFESPVYSIVPYGDFTLMVSTGHEIVALEPKISQTRRVRAARYSVLSPAVSMTAHEPYLYLSTSRESLLILKACDDKIELHAYDRQKHDGLSHIHIGGDMNLTLASSRGGRVSLLTESGVTDNDKLMPVALCEAHLPSSVMRLSTSSKPSPLSSHLKVFYGTAMNGIVYRFLILSENEWRLLRLLQNLCTRDPVICPFTPKRKRQRNPVGLESLEFQPSQMHIDGDILSRLVLRGSTYLMHMLVAEEFYNPTSLENGSAQATLERFSELARDVLGESPNQVDAVIRWLKKVFHVEF